jgi:hypothetical protein
MQRLHPADPQSGQHPATISRSFIMSVRNTALVLALATLGLSAAHAGSISTWVGGEAGFVDRPVASTISRDQVRQELQAFRSNPVAPDGGQFVGGEAGYIVPAHTYAFVNGGWMRTDRIAHNAKPQAIKSASERSAFLQQYPA